jgi:hypothetical protein
MELRSQSPPLDVPKKAGFEDHRFFVEFAEECEDKGTFERAFSNIKSLLVLAARSNDAIKTNQLTCALKAFLLVKGGHYNTHTNSQLRVLPKAAFEPPM